MARFEYKTIVLPYKSGFFGLRLPDIEEPLNRAGQDGWQLKEVVLSSTGWGTSHLVVAILEREVE
jgi:hypothetical protein